MLDKFSSLEKFEKRIRDQFSKGDFIIFQDAFISTYDIYSGPITQIPERQSDLYCSAFIIYKICLEYGIKCLGVISERKKNGEYISQPKDRTNLKIVYVGKFNYFTGKTTSKFCFRAIDKVYF